MLFCIFLLQGWCVLFIRVQNQIDIHQQTSYRHKHTRDYRGDCQNKWKASL